MNGEQILKERKAVRKTIIRDESIEVIIRISEDASDKLREETEFEGKTLQQIQTSIKGQEKELTDERKSSEDIRQPKTVEIPIIQPAFQEIEEIKANTISKIEIPERRELKIKHIHPVRFQILKPTPVEIGSIAVDLEIPETSAAKALKSVRERLLEPEFERPKEVSTVEVNTALPKIDRTAQILLSFVAIPNVVTSVRPSEVKIKAVNAVCHARSASAPSVQEITVEEFEDPIECAFGSAGFKMLSERPIIILAEKPEDENLEYIEFLKRILREIYRTRAKGLPTPAHISTDFEEVKLDIKAGKSVYVIDLDSAKIEKQSEQYLIDRIKELYSQNFGFIVLYGSKSSIKAVKGLWMPDVRGYSRLPKYIEVRVKDREAVFTLANLFWGVIEKATLDEPINLDEYVVKLEDEFYAKIEEAANDLRSVLIVEPSKEDEEGLEGESIVHYGIKAFIVNCLTKEDVPLESIQTEFEFGDAVIDVFVRHPEHGDVAIEVETLYGTTIPLLKLKKRIESRLRKGLKTWIVIPNPQFMIYFKEISALREYYKKKYRDLVEFWTLDVKSHKLIPFKDLTAKIGDWLK